MIKKLSALFIAAAMVLCLLPASEFAAASAAASGEAWDGSVDISWYDPAADEYWISTPAQLAGLAALVNGMTDPTCPGITGDASYIKNTAYPDTLLVGAGGGNVSDTVYGSALDFAYKTVHLTADLDMGGICDPETGKWSGPNWTPIGGKYPMKPQEVKGDCLVIDTRFNGVFDGGGHTVSNIYCDRFAEKGFPYSMAIGLVGYLGGKSDVPGVSGEFENGWQPAVKNVVVGTGYVYGRRMVGGVVGRVGETTNGVTVENCANFATIRNTDSKGVGGVVGSGWGDGVIRNCYNAGSVSTTFSCPAGGICASNAGMDIVNCYNVGAIYSNGELKGRGIGGHDSGRYTVSNCYSLLGCDDDDDAFGYYRGTSTKISVSVQVLDSDAMKGESFIDMLNGSGSVFATDIARINNGYPVLWFQNAAVTREYSVTLRQPEAGGTIDADVVGAGTFGSTVNFTSNATAGWTLKYFTVNDRPIDVDFYSLTSDITVSAVFAKVRTAGVIIEQNEDFYLSVTRTGYKLTDNGMEYVTAEPLKSGDTVIEENVIAVRGCGYGVSPENVDMEYTDGYAIDITNAVKNTDGTWTVTGDGEVTVSAQRGTSFKTWLSYADTDWYDPYLGMTEFTISTPEQLAGLAYLVNVEGVSFEGFTVKLGCDISLKNTDGSGGQRRWTPVGSGVRKSFRGTFDGCGYTVSHMDSQSVGSYAALFGVCVGAEIRNVTVCGTASSSAGSSYAAGVAASASGCNLLNCVSRVTVSASGNYAGGITAYCADGTELVGCVNYGAVSGTTGVGGIAGVSLGTGDSLAECANFGPVSAAGSGSYGTGGIAGRLAGELESCANYADVTSADRYTGGIVGYTTARNYSVVAACLCAGKITSSCSAANAALGGIVGYAQYLQLGGCGFTGSAEAAEGFASPYTGETIGREGAVSKITEATELPAFEPVDYIQPEPDDRTEFSIIFSALGKTVLKTTYQKGQTTVTEPQVPAVNGMNGRWDSYKLDGDVEVKAVYVPVLVCAGDTITKSGTYHIAWDAAGELKVADGIEVTLDGGCGSFAGLSLVVGKGTALTLVNVELTGEKTLLTLQGDNTVVMVGSSSVSGISDAAGNANPTVVINGPAVFEGDGELRVSSADNNAAVMVNGNSRIELKSGTLYIVKSEKLGFEGGAFYAPEAGVVISGGVLKGHTDSDNVAVLSAKSVSITGGRLLLHAERSPVTVLAEGISVTGGSIYAAGHSGNSAGESKPYAGADTFAVLSPKSFDFFEKVLSCPDVSADDKALDAMLECVEKGWFMGNEKGEFMPDGEMTRAMFVTVLYRLAGQPQTGGETGFADLAQTWYKNAVAWAVENGITAGTSETTFSPELPVSREQAAVFLFRFARLQGKNMAVAHDKAAMAKMKGVASWAGVEVYWSVQNGLFDAEAKTFMLPAESASRRLLACALSAYAREN